MAQFGQIARQTLALLHVGAGGGQFVLLALHRGQSGQFRHMGQQQIAILRRLEQTRARRAQRILAPAPTVPGRSHSPGIDPRRPPHIAVEQGAMPTRIDQAAIVMLAVDFHKKGRNVAQQRHADRAIIDIGLRSAIGLQLTPQDQRLARLDLHPRIAQRIGHHRSQRLWLKAGRHAGHAFARTDQPQIGPRAQHQPQRIEQDRLARARFAGQHAKASGKIEVKRLDQHDVADGECGQHVRALF
jgi:hypothetical protein